LNEKNTKTRDIPPHPIPLPAGEKFDQLLPLPSGERIEVRGNVIAAIVKRTIFNEKDCFVSNSMFKV